jgi:hypothetical protein
LHVYKVRDKAEKVCRNQKFMRKEAIERDKAAKLPELLPWDPNDMQNLEREVSNIFKVFIEWILFLVDENRVVRYG